MSFDARVRTERVHLAVADPEGEREAVLPVPGSIAYWENELARPLKGAIVMDEQTAQRIATALEQIALELAGGAAMPRKPVATDFYQPTTTYSPPVQPSAPHAEWAGNAQLGVPQLLPPQCPIHGKPWRNVGRGAYCATKMGDGSWCVQHPQVVTGLQGQLP